MNDYLKPYKEIYDLQKGFRISVGLWGGKLCYRVLKDGSEAGIFPFASYIMDIAGNLAIFKPKGKWGF